MLLKLLLLCVPGVIMCLRVDNICQYHLGRKLYVDLGETGLLTAGNISGWMNSPLYGRPPGPGPPAGNRSHDQCSIELVTCPSCVISLTFLHLNLSHQCGAANLLMDSPCRCDYAWVSEPPYGDVPGQQFCGISHNATYESSTRTVSIALLYTQQHQHAFTLSFTSKRNRQTISGSPKMLSNSTGTISSPFFPFRYPRDLIAEHELSCSDDAYDCRVMLVFSDFQIAAASFLELIDGDNRRMDVSSGLSFRPQVFISSGPSLLLRFYANGGSGLGYKAVYSFITSRYAETAVKPSTDCGGFVEDFGGAITMMNMVASGSQSYDCIWLIRPPANFLHLKSHLFLKVANFNDFASTTELQIRQGLTSDQPLLETLRYPTLQLSHQRAKEHVVPVSTGFYVRLKGSFNAATRLAISYTTFSYNKCFPGSEFLCNNQRCIPGRLSCDSFDHCGDGSDEPPSCYQEWDPVFGDRHPYSQTPNYIFPKTDRYADLKTATVIFLVSSLGLIALISALIVLLYRINSRARHQRELQSHLQTISDLLADNARLEELGPDEPPVYEAPPEYDDIVKAPPTSTRRRRCVSRRASRRSRSSPGERRRGSHGAPVPILEVALPAEDSTHLLAPAGHRRLPSSLSLSSIVPDSPPPPYSPTNSENFIFVGQALSNNAPHPNVSIEIIEETSSPWRVTAVTGPQPLLSTSPQSQHRRCQSLGDMPSPSHSTLRRLTQSNPLTPYESPTSTRSPAPFQDSSTSTSRFSMLIDDPATPIMPMLLQPTPESSTSTHGFPTLLEDRPNFSNTFPSTRLEDPPDASITSYSALIDHQSDFCVPLEEPVFDSPTPTSPTTASDYLFSSLESADIDGSYIRSKDFFDWEEFDRQFPRRQGSERAGTVRVAHILKKYDELVFKGERADCACQGACGCYNFGAAGGWGAA